MRELRVIGLSPDGKQIVCVDTANGQKFRLPADEKLRAASRGDMARLGQMEVEMESSLRPRDIQARIRNGASVEQVSVESGMAIHRVETFAYPVMLERSRAAQLAQKGHPVRPDGPAVDTLAEVVGAAFRARGHEIDSAEWDAWRDDEGCWVAQLQWSAGRSVNAAHWRFLPDAHGGTVTVSRRRGPRPLRPRFRSAVARSRACGGGAGGRAGAGRDRRNRFGAADFGDRRARRGGGTGRGAQAGAAPSEQPGQARQAGDAVLGRGVARGAQFGALTPLDGDYV